MKKKLALLLAIVMVLGVFSPMNLMANVSRVFYPGADISGNYGVRTILFDDTLDLKWKNNEIPDNNNNVAGDGLLLWGDSGSSWNTSWAAGNNARGQDFVLSIRENVFDGSGNRTANNVFYLELEGAQWGYAADAARGATTFNDDNIYYTTSGSYPFGTSTRDNWNSTSKRLNAFSTKGVFVNNSTFVMPVPTPGPTLEPGASPTIPPGEIPTGLFDALSVTEMLGWENTLAKALNDAIRRGTSNTTGIRNAGAGATPSEVFNQFMVGTTSDAIDLTLAASYTGATDGFYGFFTNEDRYPLDIPGEGERGKAEEKRDRELQFIHARLGKIYFDAALGRVLDLPQWEPIKYHVNNVASATSTGWWDRDLSSAIITPGFYATSTELTRIWNWASAGEIKLTGATGGTMGQIASFADTTITRLTSLLADPGHASNGLGASGEGFLWIPNAFILEYTKLLGDPTKLLYDPASAGDGWQIHLLKEAAGTLATDLGKAVGVSEDIFIGYDGELFFARTGANGTAADAKESFAVSGSSLTEAAEDAWVRQAIADIIKVFNAAGQGGPNGTGVASKIRDAEYNYIQGNKFSEDAFIADLKAELNKINNPNSTNTGPHATTHADGLTGIRAAANTYGVPTAFTRPIPGAGASPSPSASPSTSPSPGATTPPSKPSDFIGYYTEPNYITYLEEYSTTNTLVGGGTGQLVGWSARLLSNNVLEITVNNSSSVNNEYDYNAPFVPFSTNFNTIETVTIGANGQVAKNGDVLVVPLVIITESDVVDVRVNAYGDLVGGTAGAPGNTTRVGSSVETATFGQTVSRFLEVVSAARGRVLLKNLEISERTGNVIVDQGYFLLIPPVNYHIIALHPNGDRVRVRSTSQTNIPLSTSPANHDTSNQLQTTAFKGGFLGGVVSVYQKARLEVRNNVNDPMDMWREAMLLQVDGITNVNRNHRGSFEIAGLALEPVSHDPWLWDRTSTDLNITIASTAAFRQTDDDPDDTNSLTTSSTRGALRDDFDWRDTNALSTWTKPTSGTDNAIRLSANKWWRELTSARITTHAGSGAMAAAVRKDFDIFYDAAAPKKAYSGLKNQETAKVTINENTINSWNVRWDTTFTVTDADGKLLEDVKISRVVITDRTNNSLRVLDGRRLDEVVGRDTSSSAASIWNDKDQDRRYTNFAVDGHSFTLGDLHTNEGVRASIELTFYLSARANYKGPAYIAVSGPSIISQTFSTSVGNIANNGIVHVADFEPMFEVISTTTPVQIGHQEYEVSDVRIIENYIWGEKAVFNPGDRITFSIGEYRRIWNTFIPFMPTVTRDDVATDNVEGDENFRVSNVTVTNRGEAIEVTVFRGSANSNGIFDIKNITVNTTRDIPEGYYDLLMNVTKAAGGQLINNEYKNLPGEHYMYDEFDYSSIIFENYVHIVTPGFGRQTINEIRVTDDSTTYSLKTHRGEVFEKDMDGWAAREVDYRLYVPLRFVSMALGIEERNIIWDEFQKTVTIITNEGHIVQFMEGVDQYFINGIGISMHENGVAAMPMMFAQEWGGDPYYSRMYVPFRYVGNALGIPVTWEVIDGKTYGIYNPINLAVTVIDDEIVD